MEWQRVAGFGVPHVAHSRCVVPGRPRTNAQRADVVRRRSLDQDARLAWLLIQREERLRLTVSTIGGLLCPPRIHVNKTLPMIAPADLRDQNEASRPGFHGLVV